MKLLLASQSPRRKQLLEEMEIPFQTVKLDCEEIIPSTIAPENAAEYLSQLKANAYQNLAENEILLTADTVVVCNNEILGKPKNKEEATEMLKKMSNNFHFVYTAFTLKTSNSIFSKTDFAKVFFKEINDAEIAKYIEKCQPFDKAGAYGIQEWIGMTKIEKIEGSFYTIMGLPTHLVYDALQEFSLNLE